VFLEKCFTHESEALLREWILELLNQQVRAGDFREKKRVLIGQEHAIINPTGKFYSCHVFVSSKDK